MDGYFWLSLWEHIFAGFFPSVLFFLVQRENTLGKNPAETELMKIQVQSEEIPVCKGAGEIMQNVDSRRLATKSAKLTCYPILQIQS